MPKKKLYGLAFIIVLFLCEYSGGADLTSGLMAGYRGGRGLQWHGQIAKFAEHFSAKLRLGMGYFKTNPGNALEARKIFINDATNGSPEKNGTILCWSLDVLIPVDWFNQKNLFLTAGPRYLRFQGNFKYIGGNEDFDVTSSHWGWGMGLTSSYLISQKTDLIISAGLDYFFPATLYGHDTSYSPDGETVNGRHDYSYSDADQAIRQPKLNPHLLAGLQIHL